MYIAICRRTGIGFVFLQHTYPSHFQPFNLVSIGVYFPIGDSYFQSKNSLRQNHCLTCIAIIIATTVNGFVRLAFWASVYHACSLLVCRYVANIYKLFYRRTTSLLLLDDRQHECCFAHSLAIMTSYNYSYNWGLLELVNNACTLHSHAHLPAYMVWAYKSLSK